MRQNIAAQDAQKRFSVIGVNTQYNTILAHSKDIVDVSRSNPYAFGVEIGRIDTSEANYAHCNCYSEVGFGLNYTNFDFDEVLGSGLTFYFFYKPYLLLKSKWSVRLQSAMGITYLNQVYNEESNPSNLFFSSPISFRLTAGLIGQYAISEQWKTQIGLTYHHISNGGIKEPNKGMNYPGVDVGLTYSLKPLKLRPKSIDYKQDRSLIKEIRIFGAVTTLPETPEFEEKRKPFYGLLFGVLKPVSNINGISFHFETWRDEAVAEEIKRVGGTQDFHFITALLGHNFLLGNFIFNQQMGFYIYEPFDINPGKFYQRYEMLYGFTNGLQLGCSLKAHGHIAYHLDLRVGFAF